MNLQLTAPQRASATIALPFSKSITNRALLIQALCDDRPQVLHPALCDDTAVMVKALAHNTNTPINIEGSGTAMRFLTAYFATRQGLTVTLDGNQRMRQRPIGVLVDALRSLGADISYLGEDGFPLKARMGAHVAQVDLQLHRVAHPAQLLGGGFDILDAALVAAQIA